MKRIFLLLIFYVQLFYSLQIILDNQKNVHLADILKDKKLLKDDSVINFFNSDD